MSEPSRLRFGAFEIDLVGEELLENGRPVKLARQPFRVLRTLALRSGQIVSRDDLKAAVWTEDTHVDFDGSLHSCVKQVRAALGDEASAPRFIETLPRRGYRFLPETSVAETARTRPRSGAVAALLGVALVAVGLIASRRSHETAAGAVDRPLTLVVLPFEDDAYPYKGPALADEVVRSLSALDPSRLAVLASTSATRVGGGVSLDTDFVLTGQNHEGALEVELEHHRSVVWRGSASDVTGLVAALVPRLLPDVPVPSPNERDPAAYDAYLKGSYHLNRAEEGSLERAERYLCEALELDDGLAEAHVGLANVYFLTRRYDEAVHEASRALALKPSAEAYFALALARWYGEWDWPGAGESFQRALLANPGYARAHHWYAYYLTGLGRHDEAIEEIERASKLDPLSPQVQSDVGWFYYFAGRYDEALVACERTLELEPGFELAKSCIDEARLALGKDARHHEVDLDSYTEAVWLLRGDEPRRAIEALSRAIAEKNLWVPMLSVDPRFERLRTEYPGDYAHLLEAAGFP